MSFINSLKSGHYSGKGFKAARHKKYKKALYYYELALKYSEHDIDPVLYDSKAIALYNLNRFDEALINAKKGIEQYNSVKNKDQKIVVRIKILNEMVQHLESEK
ncbi:MAG: hypothetical protein WC799_22350 [Desulfobacteraceae bacterium]|jgi:tetratricopeptide (TPR) repeat protein